MLLSVSGDYGCIAGKRGGQQTGQRGMVERLRNVVRRHRDRKEGWDGSDVGKRQRRRATRTWQDVIPFGSGLPISYLKSRSRSPWETPVGRGRRVSAVAIRRGPRADTKNPRIIWNNDPGMPWSIHVSMPFPNPRGMAVMFQAGILTPGSSSGHVFPTLRSVTHLRPLSPVTAAGPSPIHTEFPFDPLTEEPETCE